MEGLDPLAVVALEDALQLLVHELDAVQQRRGVGVFFRRLDRPLYVIEHGQQISQQSEVGVAQPLVQFAGGPLAAIVQFRMAAELAVLGSLQFAAKLGHRIGHGGPRLGLRFRRWRFCRRDRQRRLGVGHSFHLVMIVLMFAHGQNNSFSFSKKLFRVGLTCVLSISASFRSASSCSGASVRGTSM